jgi:hypothetical protein
LAGGLTNQRGSDDALFAIIIIIIIIDDIQQRQIDVSLIQNWSFGGIGGVGGCVGLISWSKAQFLIFKK